MPTNHTLVNIVYVRYDGKEVFLTRKKPTDNCHSLNKIQLYNSDFLESVFQLNALVHFKCCKITEIFPPCLGSLSFYLMMNKQRRIAYSSKHCISLMIHHGIRT